VDIEAYSRGRFPNPSRPSEKIICVTVYDTKHKTYVTLLLDDEVGKERRDGHLIMKFREEANLLSAFRNYLGNLNPDVVTGWNVDFDVNYLTVRAKMHGIHLDWSPCCIFDMLSAYQKIYQKGSNKLKEVAFSERLCDEIEPEVVYADLWENDREGLVQRNKRHTEWCARLDEKKRLIEFFWELKNQVGLESLKETLYHGVLVDTLLLRKYRGKYVLPSKSSRRESESYEGALVLKPDRGIFENVAVFDMSRYYPNIIIAYNLSPEPRSDNEMGEVPKLCMELMELRDKFDRELKNLTPGSKEYEDFKRKRDAVKYLLNAVYGYFGSPSSRLYVKSLAEKVTEVGRKGLRFIIEKAKERGLKPIYADTDSIMIRVDPEEAPKLEEELNNMLKEFCEREGVKSVLRLKLEKIFSKVLFKGVKKRYAGRVIYDGGWLKEPYTHVVGFEYVRRDSAPLTREVQRKIFDLMLEGDRESIISYLRDVVRKVKSGEYSLRDIAINKTLSRNPEDYRKVVPDFVRGALYIRAGDTVRMIYVRRMPNMPPTDVVCFLDEADLKVKPVIDYERQIDRVIRMKVEDLLDLVGLDWSQIHGQKTLTHRSLKGVFG